MIKVKHKAVFCTVEGCEGSGKSTVTEMLRNNLLDEGYKVYKTREPGGNSEISTKIRAILLEKGKENLSAMSEYLLYQVCRSQLVTNEIAPYLNKNYIILCDRFIDSTVAYQLCARGLGLNHNFLNLHYKLQEFVLNCNGTIYNPDLTLYFDVEPEVGLKRSKKRLDSQGSKECRFEDLELSFHNSVRKGYLHVCRENPKRVFSLDSNKLSLDELFTQSKEIILNKLNSL